ncbi:acyltransferase [Pseudoalteromonas prydzensis]|uniref:acyltransferase n=1 Tax=Pseudoalteromonas prydzensis TaxID=182141 RepID=UPI003FD1A6CC
MIKGRFYNIELGKRLKIDKNTGIYIGKNKLKIGDDVYLRSKSQGYHAGMAFPTTILIDEDDAECIIGNNCRINGAYIHSKKSIQIGNNVLIASGVNILDSNGHELLSPDRTKSRDSPEKIIIGNNVWVGLNSTILKGSHIGDNSVVAAGSVVKGVYPKNVLLQGNPATIVKKLEVKE